MLIHVIRRALSSRLYSLRFTHFGLSLCEMVLQEDTHWSPRYREDPGTYHFSNYHSLIAGGWECNLNSGSLSVNCHPDCLGRGVEGLHWEVEAQLEANVDMQEGLCPASLWESRACLLSRVGAFVREHPG